MKKSHAWVSLALALVIAANSLAPAAAVAANSKPIRPIDNDDPPPMPQVDQTGDPDPDSGGLTIRVDGFALWSEALLASFRMQFAHALAQRNVVSTRDRAAKLSMRLGGPR